MKITSSAFEHNQSIPSKYTCDAENINPPLAFSEISEDAKSLVLIVDDPDAPGGTWVHWVVYNIAPSLTQVAEDAKPENAIEGVTNFGQTNYGGPCPPNGEHRYFFKLYALDEMLSFDDPSKVTKKVVEEAMNGHILDKAELVGLYSRV